MIPLRYFSIFTLLFLLLSSFTFPSKKDSELKAFTIEGFAQGTSYQITYYAKSAIISSKSVHKLFSELDSSLSIYKPYSLINKFNNSENGIEMDDHLLKVVKRSLKIWKQSEGIFDISILPLVDLWGFGANKRTNLPDENEIAQAISCSGSDKIKMKGSRLIKTKACIKIDVNGIAQGYSVDQIAEVLEKKGIKNYIVELGGEIRVKGHKAPNKQPMRIGIETFTQNMNDTSSFQKVLELKKGAVTSSGNYRRFIQSGSKKLSHLMDIKSGRPLENEIISVTVRAKNAMDADGYDNALIGMGIDKAFQFLKKHKKIEAYFIYKDKNGAIRDTSSINFYK